MELNEELKKCCHCTQDKLLSDFGRNSKMPDGKNKECKICVNERYKRLYADDKICKESIRRSYLRREYDMTPEEYEDMFVAQDGVCAVCKESEMMAKSGKAKLLAIDHNHATGKIRGLLCSNCNIALGKLKEDKIKILSLLKYITKYEGN